MASHFSSGPKSVPAVNPPTLPTGWTTANVSTADDMNALDQAVVGRSFDISLDWGSGKADPTFSRDSHAAIVGAIEACANEGGGFVYAPPGTYGISADIEVPEKVILSGAGWSTTIKALPDAGDDVAHIVKLVQADYAGVWDICLDGNNTNRNVTVGNCGLAVLGSSHGRFRNVRIRDVGKSAVSSGGIGLWVAGFEASSTNNPAPGTTLVARFNLFEGVVVDDSLKKTNFVIRCQSEFDIDQPRESFLGFCSHNTFSDGFSFGGSFVTNQIAGPAAISNKFSNWQTKNWSTNEAYLVDKGALSTTLVGCAAIDFVTPGAEVPSTSGPTAFRVQGLGNYAKTHVFPTVGTVISGCVARGWGPATGDTSGYEGHQDEDTVVIGNTFDMTSESGELNGMIFAQGSQRVSVIGNTIIGARNGIVNYPFNMQVDLEDWSIRDNVISARELGIALAAAEVGVGFKHAVIQNNTIIGCENAAIALDMSTGNPPENCVIDGNKIRNCGNGIRFTGSGHKIRENSLEEIATYGLFALEDAEQNIPPVTDCLVSANYVQTTGSIDSACIAGFTEAFLLKNSVTPDNLFVWQNTDDRIGRRHLWAYGQPGTGFYRVNDRVHQHNATLQQLEWVCAVEGDACQVPWVNDEDIEEGDRRFADDGVYECSADGTTGTEAPSGTGDGIEDGTAEWDYVGPRAIFKLFAGNRGVINVGDYGLAAGGTNHQKAFDAAVADLESGLARVMAIPAGAWYANMAPELSGFEIVGYGRGAVELHPVDLAKAVIGVGNGTTAYNSVAIRSVALFGDGSTNTSDGIDVHGAFHVVIDNVTLGNFGRDGIRVRSSATLPSFDIHASNFSISGCRGKALNYAYGSTYVQDVSISNFRIDGYDSVSAYALHTNVTVKATNGRFHAAGNLKGGIYIDNTSGDVPVRLMCSNVVGSSNGSSSDVIVQFNTASAGNPTDRIRGTFDFGGYAKWLSDSSTVYLGDFVPAMLGTGGVLSVPNGGVFGNLSVNGYIQFNGSLGGGSNNTGHATLSGGTVTVSTPLTSAGTVVLLSRKTLGSSPGTILSYAVNIGTGFTISSNDAGDDGVIGWHIWN